MENFSAGVLDRWGIGYEPGQGVEPGDRLRDDERTGPRRSVVEDDHLRADDPRPVRADVPVQPARPARRRARLLAQRPRRRACAAAVAVLSAIEARRRTGEGQHIDIAQMETGTYLIGPAVLDHLANGREAHPIGNADPFGQWCPNEVYRCGDQHEVAITCRDDDDWAPAVRHGRRWDIADLAGDARARDGRRADRPGRRDRRAAAPVVRQPHGRGGAPTALQANGVPAGTVQDGGDLMADPQLRRPRLLAARPTTPCSASGPTTASRRCGARTDLEPYLLVRRLHRRAQLRGLPRPRRHERRRHRRRHGRRPLLVADRKVVAPSVGVMRPSCVDAAGFGDLHRCLALEVGCAGVARLEPTDLGAERLKRRSGRGDSRNREPPPPR